MNETRLVIGNHIQKLRKDNNMTQQQLSEALGLSPKAISKWERGESSPEIETLIKIADLFYVKVDYLVRENFDENKGEYLLPKIKARNKLLYCLLTISVVFTIFTIVFVYMFQLAHEIHYQFFIWAFDCFLLIVLAFYYNKGRSFKFIIYSLLVWVTILCFYLEFLQYNLYLLYLIGIPSQIALIIWSKIFKFSK